MSVVQGATKMSIGLCALAIAGAFVAGMVFALICFKDYKG